MKKALGILLVLALLLTVFVSCSQEAGQSVAEELASVSFDGSKARALLASRDPFNPDEYVWTYTAQKADASGLTTGETATEQRINTGKGLSGKVPGFSQGYWNFTLYAYAAVEGSTEGTFEPIGSALYSGTASHVKVAKGASNVVTVSVSPATTGTGYIAFDKANLALKALKSGEDINAQGDTRSVNFSYGIYAITDTTFSNNLINEGTAGKTALDAGSYFVRVSYTYDDDDDFVIADEAIVAVVYGGQTTTIKGTIGELSTDVSFGANPVEIPSAEGEPVAVPADMVKDETYEEYKDRTGEDVNAVTLKNAETEEAATVVATVPKEAVYSLLQESISEDPNTTSAMSLDLTVDINTQETTASKKAYDINLIKTVETTTTTSTGTSTSTNASLVKNVAEYVAATIKVGAGLRDVEVYHSDVLMKEVTADQYEGDVSTLDKGAGVYYYDGEAGVLYLKTKSFSPFVVTFTPDTIPEESKVVNVTREIGYADLQEAVDAAAAGDTVKLLKDIDLSDQIVVTKKLTLDLNGQKLYNTIDLWDKVPGSWSLVSVQGKGALTITGNGTLDAKENDCHAIDVRDIGATLVVENGTFVGNITAIYAYEGFVTVKGGSFDLKQLDSGSGEAPYRYMLNCLDASYTADKAGFTVTGGSFHMFNPADNASETGGHTNYVPEGYESVYDSVNETYMVEILDLKVVETGEQMTLVDFAASVNAGNDYSGKTVIIQKNVDLSNEDNWVAIGTSSNLFSGSFNGNGKTIALPANKTLFGWISDATIENVTVVLSGDEPSIVLRVEGSLSELRNVVVKGDVTFSGSNDGAFVVFDFSSSLKFTNCINQANIKVTGPYYVYEGIFVGYVSGSSSATSYRDLVFVGCGNEGYVVGNKLAFFIGNPNSNYISCTISDCYNSGTIIGTTDVAQHIFNLYVGTGSNCYYDFRVNGHSYGCLAQGAYANKLPYAVDDEVISNTGLIAKGAVDPDLCIVENVDGTFTITPSKNSEIHHYLVSVGTYVKLTAGGSSRTNATETILADAESFVTVIKDFEFVDAEWVQNNPSAVESEIAGNPVYTTLEGKQYYLINKAFSGLYTLNGVPKKPEMIGLTAFDENNKPIISISLSTN